MKKDHPQSQIVIYQTADGQAKINVHFEGETAWLTQKMMAELFEVAIPTVNEHLKNIYSSSELSPARTIRKFLIVQKEGQRDINRHIEFYNLDAIISVGYRVNSAKATKFRIWATARLRDYIIKGFAMDDERMKQGGQRARYFEELLQRVRDIRSSERNFYQKVTDIYATSIDYRQSDTLTKKFFATVQNKMHYAVHGHTAAEIVSLRADSAQPAMGLSNFPGKYITAGDVKIAKNYLSAAELKQLNLIVSLYLDFAELQATNERPMKMAEWIGKLDDFLKLSEKNILLNAGKISAAKANAKAEDEFAKYKLAQEKNRISDFDREVKKILKLKKK